MTPPKQIFYKGVDVLDFPITKYWKDVALARQSPFLFSQTIRENIAIQPSTWTVDDRVCNRPSDASLVNEIESFPDGLETRVGERGVTLSGGQRQRTALARLFYRDFNAILLDDVMSAVDHATETKLIDAVYRRVDTTRLIVSHRTSVLARADKIIVLDQGKVADEGTHEVLIERPGPISKPMNCNETAPESPHETGTR